MSRPFLQNDDKYYRNFFTSIVIGLSRQARLGSQILQNVGGHRTEEVKNFILKGNKVHEVTKSSQAIQVRVCLQIFKNEKSN